MASTAGRKAWVRVPGTPLTLTAEAAANTGDNQTYRITNTARRVFPPDAAITVLVAATATGESYTLNRLRGEVRFATVNAGRGAVTITGTYLPMATALRAKGYSYALSATNADDTDFDSANTASGFRNRLQTQLDVSGSIGSWWSTDILLRDALLNAGTVVIEVFPDRSATRDLACWAVLSKSDVSAAVDNAIEASIEFQGEADADGRAASL